MFARNLLLSLGLLSIAACTPITTSGTAVDQHNAPAITGYDANLEPGRAGDDSNVGAAIERRLGLDRTRQIGGGGSISAQGVGFDAPETAPPPRSCTRC